MRREVQLVQGTDEWHSWRRERITASNVPVILLESDFQTPYELWCGYIHQPTEKAPPTFAMQRGHALEGVVRDEFCLHVGREFYPVCFENTAYPFLGASLDGWAPIGDSGIVLEIKVPSREKHQLALNGQVPRTYMGQIQAQLLITEATHAEYVSYDPQEKSWARVTVLPDQRYFERIIKAAQAFMDLVRAPPH
jgi:putative phage-type endonuclease